VIAVPSDFVSIDPKNAFHNNPSMISKYGIVGYYTDPRTADRTDCTPSITVENLPQGKGVEIKSGADIAAWATNFEASVATPGQVTQSTNILGVHQGYAVAVVISVPPGEMATTQYYVDAYFSSPSGIWALIQATCGDTSWANVSSIFSATPDYFEAPPN
jgi:hypothetical protein